MKKVLIIDDEALARSIVRNYLEGSDDFEVVAECANGFVGAKAIAEHKPDLIFLDVQMPKLNGFEMLEVIDEKPGVIFTTAFDEYAIKAFEVAAIDYLLKPFSKERFEQAVIRWKQHFAKESTPNLQEVYHQQPDQQTRIVVKDGNEITIIPAQEIVMIEAYDDYVKLHTQNKKYLKSKTMNFYERTLDAKDFIRIHRSYIININHLNRIEAFEKNSFRAVLTNNAAVPISRSTYPELKKILGL